MSSEKGFDKTTAEVKRLKALLRQREEENVGLSKKVEQLESELDDIHSENRDLKEVINRAKNISPWARPNLFNVRAMALRAGIDIVKASGGWVVKMASRIGRKFKRLRDIWLILTQEEWYLHNDFFPHPEVVESQAPAPAPAPPPLSALLQNQVEKIAPAPTPPPLSALLQNQIEVLRAEWHSFPSARPAIEERMAKFGIVLEPT